MVFFIRVLENVSFLKKTESCALKSFFIVSRTTKITLKAKREKKLTFGINYSLPFFIRQKNLRRDFNKRSHFTRIKPFNIGILSLSMLGMLETFYLLFQKLKETPIFCVNQTCSIVLNSSFSEIFGIPLVFFGLLSYFLVGFFTLKGVEKTENRFFFFRKKSIHWFLVLFGSMDLYFIFILECTLKTFCIYCIFSIFFSGSILFLKSLAQTGCNTIQLKLLIFFEIFLISLIFFNYIGNIVEMTAYLN